MIDLALVDLFRSRPVARHPAIGGYTPAERWIVDLVNLPIPQAEV